MADKIYKKLPVIHQTNAIKNFFDNTVEQLFSKANVELVKGFIGSQRGEDHDVEGAYIIHPTASKRFYSLSPTVSTKTSDTNKPENLIFYDEFIDLLKSYGVQTKNHNKLFSDRYSTFLPPINVDKFINYQEYYWVPEGPSVITITGTASDYIDIDLDILGKKTYTLPNGKSMRNGMKVEFSGNYVIPATETSKTFIVSGVGDAIKLTEITSNNPVSYRLDTSVDWEKDYLIQERGATNKNAWSRVNHWYHIENFRDAGDSIPEKTKRANRPIIEFDKELELYKHGEKLLYTVNVSVADFSIADVKGLKTGQLVDSVDVSNAYMIFPNEDKEVSQYIYQGSNAQAFVTLSRVPALNNPAGAVDGDDNFIPMTPVVGDVVCVDSGSKYLGSEYVWTSVGWVQAQHKSKINQEPLFNLYDNKGQYLGDSDLYPQNNFTGNKIFGYATSIPTGESNTSVSLVSDIELGFPLVYKQFKSSSEILFENFQKTGNYNFIPFGGNSSKNISGYKFYKLNKKVVEYHAHWKHVSEPNVQKIVSTYSLPQAVVDRQIKDFYIGAEPKSNPKFSSGYEITVTLNGDEITGFQYFSTNKGFIRLDSIPYSANDILEISVNSEVGLIDDQNISKYELPIGWKNNVLKQDIVGISQPQYMEHFSDYMSNQEGFSGLKFGSNNSDSIVKSDTFANKIVNTDQNVILGSFLLDDQPHNLIDALKFNRAEYVKFKNRIKNEINKYYDTKDTDGIAVSDILEQVIRNTQSYKVGRDVFNRTYILPYGDNYKEEEFLVGIPSTPADKTFTSVYDADLDKLEHSLLVFLNQKLLTVDHDYVISSFEPLTITIQDSVNLSSGDTVLFKLYDAERDSAQCPPTPSTMGLYPLFKPEITIDKSFSQPLKVIIGHDGSETPIKGDLRDDLLLEFEKRIFNSAKAEFRTNNSMPEHSVFSSQNGEFRKTSLEYKEFNDLMISSYSSWLQRNNLDGTVNEFYDENNKFTWNYANTGLIPGHWKGFYLYYYDTIKPNTHPWEMLGFTEKPIWWDSEYALYASGDTNKVSPIIDYSPTNEKLWNDLEQGIIRKGPRANIHNDAFKKNNPFRRIGLHEVIPVDSNGDLIAPADIISTDTTTLTKQWNNEFVNALTDIQVTSFARNDGVSVSLDSGNLYVQSHTIPNHTLDGLHYEHSGHATLDGESIEFDAVSYTIPKRDLANIPPTGNSQKQGKGPVAVAVNGIPVYNIKSEESWKGEGEWHYSTVTKNHDPDSGHASVEDGILHYHVFSPRVAGLTEWSTTEHSPIVGWALDGLPIYGPYGYGGAQGIDSNSIVRIKSKWAVRSGTRQSGPGGAYTGQFIEDWEPTAGSGDEYVDEYNVRYARTPESPNTPIRFYVATVDENNKPVFPFHVGGSSGQGTSGNNVYQNCFYSNAPDTGLIKEIKIKNKGGQYTNATVAITGNGSGATATATIVDGAIQAITITNSGSGYTEALATIQGDGYRAILEVVIDETDNNKNNGYINQDADYYIRSTLNTSVVSTTGISGKWSFGDCSPAEYAWRNTEEFPFAMSEALLLSKPGLFATFFSNPISLTRPSCNKEYILNKNTGEFWKFYDPTEFHIHGELDQNKNFITAIGYTQFIYTWLKFQNLSIVDDFATKMRTLNTNLAQRMSGFIDKDTMVARTDQYSNDGNATSLIIPQENINVNLHSSNYKSRNFYSGIIIEKSAGGYIVRGYDKNRGYFNVLPVDPKSPKSLISVGGEPAPHVKWAPEQSYPKGTIVEYNRSYFRAKLNVTSGTNFDPQYWNTLSKLPQKNGAEAALYQVRKSVPVRVYYDTEFETIQEVFDLLIGLGAYNNQEGFDFGEFDGAINDVNDWMYAGKQFLFWTTGKWEIGNTIELSPLAKRLLFTAPRGFIAKINRTDRDQFSIIDQTGAVVDPGKCQINREGSQIEIIPPLGQQIYGCMLFTKEIEHALVFDNQTVFADVIFDNLYDQRHKRIKIKANRTKNWTGKFFSEGFIIDGDELRPNLDNMAESLGRYHELGFVPVEKQLYEQSRALFGYQEKSYLTELDVLDEQQFEFYQGMIQNKGTKESLTRLANSNSIVQGNITVYDEWALRVGDFGNTKNKQNIELKLYKTDFKQNSQLIKLDYPQSTTNCIERIDVFEARYNYERLPEIEISMPSNPKGKRATAVAKLNSNNKLDSIIVTESGSGYDDPTALAARVVASNVLINEVETVLDKALAIGNTYITDTTSTEFEITDHVSESTVRLTVTHSDGTSNVTGANIASAINSNTSLNVNVTASSITNYTDLDANASVIDLVAKDIITLSGSDFTVVDGANIGITNARYQPQQKFSLVGALANEDPTYTTTANDIVVEVDDANVPRVDPNNPLDIYWTFDEGSNFSITTLAEYPSLNTSNIADADNNAFELVNNSVSLAFNSAQNIDPSNLVKGDNSQYKYVEVFVNNVRIYNSPSTYTSDGTLVSNGNVFTLATNSITFNDISLLPDSVLTAKVNPPGDYDANEQQRDTYYALDENAVIQIIERPTLTFTENFVGDLPNSKVRIKVTAKEGIAPRVGIKRTYDVVPSSSKDILVFDIDDATRFLKKPEGDKISKLWPTTANVDIFGMTDSNYPRISNAGYVNSANVNFLAFDVESISDLYRDDFIFKPKQNDYIHVAKSENEDWNVYELIPAGDNLLSETASKKVNYLERSESGNVTLFTNYSLISYIDSNQIGEINTGKYLDFVLSLQNANVNDNIVVWNNERIIREATSKVRGFEAPRQIEARIQSIGPLNSYDIISTEPVVSQVLSGLRASIVSSSDGNTVQLTGSIGTISNGDAVQIIDNIGTKVQRDAVVATVTSGNVSLNPTSIANLTITSAGSGYSEPPTVTVTPDLGATITANIEGNVSTVNIITDNNFQRANVSLGGGGGTGATVRTDIFDAEIVGFTITDPGQDYLYTGPDSNGDYNATNPVTVTITPPSSGTTATAEVRDMDVDPVTGQILNINILERGSGYESNNLPTVTITGTGGQNATAVPILQGNVRAVVTNIGSGYTQAPAVTIHGDGTGFSGEAVINAKVTALNVVNGGVGFTSTPTISISGSATATPNMNFGNAEIDQNILDDSSGSFANTSITVTGSINVDTQFGLPSDANTATIAKIQSLFTKTHKLIGYSQNPTNALLHINEPLLEDANVVSNINNLAFVIKSYKDYSSDTGRYHIVSNVTQRSFTITRPNSVAGNALSVRHLNNTKLVTRNPDLPLSDNDIVRVFANNFEGMFRVKSSENGNITIPSPFTFGYQSGTITTEGIKIKTVSDHGISPLYAEYGKRIAVHFASPKAYNQIYSINKVTPKELYINNRWAKSTTTQIYYDHKIGTINGSVPYESGNINADFANSTNSIGLTRSTDLTETVVKYSSNAEIVNPRFVSIVEDGSVCVIHPDALPSDTQISIDVDVQRDMGRNILYPQLSTVDQGVVTLKGSQQHLTSYLNPQALENDLNRTIKLKQSFTDPTSMTTVNPKTGLPSMQLKIPMLKSPWIPVVGDTPAPLIHDYGPYVLSTEALNSIQENSVTGSMVIGSEDESRIDPNFYKGPIQSGPVYGLRYVKDDINYIWDNEIQMYVPEETIVKDGVIVNDKQEPRIPPMPEFHVGTYMQTNNLDYINEDLVLKQIPGSANSSRSWRPGRKQQTYNMLDKKTFTAGSDSISIPTYRLRAIKNENVFLIYQAVQNSDNHVYYIKLDESNPPNIDHDFNATLNRYADFGQYDTTDYYWRNEILPSIDSDNKITEPKDPIRLRKTKNIVNLKAVEPAAYVGPQLIPEPFALAGGNNSDRIANFTALPSGTQAKLSTYIDYPIGEPGGILPGGAEGEEIYVPQTGFGQFLLWTPGLAPGQWAPTSGGPGSVDNETLGYGSGYYQAGDDHDALDYPDVSDLTYDKPISRFKYSRRFTVNPPVFNVDRRLYEINGVRYTEEDLTGLQPDSRSREGDSNQAFWDGIFEDINGVDREIDYNFFFDEEWWDYLEIDEVVSDGVANENDNDEDNTLLRPEHIFVACFWTEPFTYVDQITGYNYDQLDADGNPAPIYSDYDGTVVRVKYIRLTELPPNAITRRLIPDTGWAGKGWNNVTVDYAINQSGAILTPDDVDSYIDQFDPVETGSASTGDDDTLVVDLPALTRSATPIPVAGSTQNYSLSNTRLLSSGELEQQLGFQSVPTVEGGAPVNTLAKITQAPGPCLAIETPDDPTPPGTTAPGVCTEKETQYFFEEMNDGLEGKSNPTGSVNTTDAGRSFTTQLMLNTLTNCQAFFDSNQYGFGGDMQFFFSKTVEIATSGSIDVFLNSHVENDTIKAKPWGNATGYVLWQSKQPLFGSSKVMTNHLDLGAWLADPDTRLLKTTMNNANDIPTRNGDQISRYGVDQNLTSGANRYTQVDAIFDTNDKGLHTYDNVENISNNETRLYNDLTFTRLISELNDDDISVKWSDWDSDLATEMTGKGFNENNEFGFNGIGYIRALNVDCNKGKYITLWMVPSLSDTAGNTLRDVNGSYANDYSHAYNYFEAADDTADGPSIIRNQAVIRFVGEKPDDYVPPGPSCDDTNRPSRAYRNGAVLKGWKALRDDNNSAQDAKHGEDWWGSKREVDNVYWPYHDLYISPSYFKSFSNSNIWKPWRTRTAGSAPIVNRTVKSFHKYNSGQGQHSYELKGYMFAPHTGVYYFSGWGDDQLIVYLSSGPPEPDLDIWNAYPNYISGGFKNYARIGVPDDGSGPSPSGGDAAPGTFKEWFTDDGFNADNGYNYISTANVAHNGCWTDRLESSKENVANGPAHNWLMKTGWTTTDETKANWWNQWSQHRKAVYLEANKFYFIRLMFSNRGGPGHYGLMWTCNRAQGGNISGYPIFGGFSCEDDAPPSDGTPPGQNSGGGGGCFTGHMKVTMADGTQKEIKDVVKGDAVKSYDNNTNEIVNATVEELMVPRTCNIYELTLDDGTVIETTADHPFRTADGKWANIDPNFVQEDMQYVTGLDSTEQAEKLEIGRELHGLVDNAVVTNIVNTGKTDTVYHLCDVGEYHNYFVEDMCVHNSATLEDGNEKQKR